MVQSETIPVLAFKGVSFAYPGMPAPILDQVDLHMVRGERVGIIGGNGSGKSTLSKLILGILMPQAGRIELLGKPVHWSRHFPEVGYIGDPGHNAEELGLPTHHKLGAVISILQKIEGESTVSARKLDELLQQLGLQKLWDRRIENLSTGERKRLMVCLTFMRSPNFILMDEPLDGLDETVCVYIKGLIATAMADSDCTLFYIAHDRVEIDSYTDRVYRLKNGKLVLEPQRWFEGQLNHIQGAETFREKTGQVIGRLTTLMGDEKTEAGFELRINPVDP